MIRIFLERLIDWDWPDAPGRNPILHGDIPPRPEPLPKFLNDQDAAKLMAAAPYGEANLSSWHVGRGSYGALVACNAPRRRSHLQQLGTSARAATMGT